MNAAGELIDVFCGIDRPVVMKRFFGEIFTPAEIDDFVLRWRLMSMLSDGVPQRSIASQLGISLCKITRGARILKARNSITRRILRNKIVDK